MDKKLVEWAVAKRGVVVEHGAMWGRPMGDFAGERLDAVRSADEGGCGCGGCGCDMCQPMGGHACPMCGKMLMSDGEGCDECMTMKGWGADDDSEDDDMDEMKSCSCMKDPCECGRMDEKVCDECGGYMDEGICDECGRSAMVESVIIEAKKRKKHKGPSKATQKKIAKSWMKKGKKFSTKVKHAKKAGLGPGFIAKAEKLATGKWPREK